MIEAARPKRLDPLAVRMLVVDNEAPIGRLLRVGFARDGYEVLDASSEQGLQPLAGDPDLMVLKLDFPIWKGSACCGQTATAAKVAIASVRPIGTAPVDEFAFRSTSRMYEGEI